MAPCSQKQPSAGRCPTRSNRLLAAALVPQAGAARQPSLCTADSTTRHAQVRHRARRGAELTRHSVRLEGAVRAEVLPRRVGLLCGKGAGRIARQRIGGSDCMAAKRRVGLQGSKGAGRIARQRRGGSDCKAAKGRVGLQSSEGAERRRHWPVCACARACVTHGKRTKLGHWIRLATRLELAVGLCFVCWTAFAFVTSLTQRDAFATCDAPSSSFIFSGRVDAWTMGGCMDAWTMGGRGGVA
eukprot:364321-Chlamydomonas_euryale.AAC.6